jgi:hypothetical protein
VRERRAVIERNRHSEGRALKSRTHWGGISIPFMGKEVTGKVPAGHTEEV